MIIKKFIILGLCCLSPLCASINYDVQFMGFKEQGTLNELHDSSSLILLKKKPPRSINSLRFRAEDDLPALLRVLHNHGYYDATIKIQISPKNSDMIVYLFITPGQRYRLASYDILDAKTREKFTLIPLENLSIELGGVSYAQRILDARGALLAELAKKGLPLASVTKQEVVVDNEKKQVNVKIFIDAGPVCNFGSVSMVGLEKVKPAFVERKIIWKKDEIYSPKKVEETQDRLLKSDLFSSVMITHAGELDPKKELPIKIDVQESKHHNISIGATYASIDGPGVLFRWSNRNLRGMGEKFYLDGEFAKNLLTGSAIYVKPDVFVIDQNYVAELKAQREHIHVYLAFTYSFLNHFDRQWNDKTSYSFGIEEECDLINESINNGKYWLFSLPSYIRYTTTRNILDPTKGVTVLYHPVLYQELNMNHSTFFKQRLTTNVYIPFVDSKKIVLAFRLQLGSIAGASLRSVPMTKLFFGGSDDDLRGYRYHTVSPSITVPGKEHRRPTGGRGAVFFTFEPRLRITETIGVVPFADFGCVTREWYPSFTEKWYKSVGIGLRYYTFFGPLRIDVGFPLDRRPYLDPKYRIYISIGQTF